VETGAGIKVLEMQVENGKVVSVKVDMGEPELTSELSEKITIDGQEHEFTGISMGNPHAVYYVDDVSVLDLEKIGPSYENHERFPNRVNSEFVQLLDRGHVKMRVWERGSGETLACGTGATACAVASMMLGLVDDTVEVQLLGGNLLIHWDRETNHAFMTGPAAEVYHGEIEIPKK
jgi:diaminopimelate epimerase